MFLSGERELHFTSAQASLPVCIMQRTTLHMHGDPRNAFDTEPWVFPARTAFLSAPQNAWVRTNRKGTKHCLRIRFRCAVTLTLCADLRRTFPPLRISLTYDSTVTDLPTYAHCYLFERYPLRLRDSTFGKSTPAIKMIRSELQCH